jgi:Glycosyl transferase 4-like domain
MSNHRVLFITLHFPPSREIGAHACEQIARYFPLYGWDPVILTRPKHLIESPDPNHRRTFPGKIVEAGVLPHPISIYRKLKQMLRRSGSSASVGDANLNERQYGRMRRWVLSVLHTPDIYTGWLVPAAIAGMRVIRREQITHILSSGPFWTNHLVGLMLARLTGLPWTVHFRDPWNQVPQAKPVSALSARLEKWLERLVITRADSVVCVTEAHTRLLRQIFAQVPANQFITIPNGFDGAEWDAFEVDPTADRSRFVITYPGSFMMGTRSPRPLFRALRQLIDAGDVDANALSVELFGNCDVAEGIRVTDMAAEYGLSEFVHVGPPLSRPETLRRMAKSNLLLLLAEGWTLQIPGKTYEYLRAGRPILSLTSDGALAGLLRRTGGAWVADPGDHAAIARAVREVYVAWRMGHPIPAADPALVADFDRRRLAGRFAALFKERPSVSGDPVASWEFDTPMLTAADVAVLPATSRATAVSVCEPFDVSVVSHETAHGAAVSSVPSATPSR